MSTIPAAALTAHRDTTRLLHEWAGTVHRLVEDRITALAAAYGPRNHPTESDREYAARVLAHGQRPYPPGVSMYAEAGLNIEFSHVEVTDGSPEDDGPRVTFHGHYPHWDASGDDFEMRTAEVHCPAWVMSDPDGVQRYRAQTAEMATRVLADRADEDAAIDEIINRVLADRADDDKP